ncbi:MAG: hypothetical protein M3081_18005 [Gemmatimonadota bacterium]|nr:hypothetical protein [Gemmatimonadota bacterium]
MTVAIRLAAVGTRSGGTRARFITISAACGVVLAGVTGLPAAAQGPTDVSAAEVAAARYILEHHVSATTWIDSAFARAEDAPGRPVAGYRGVTRMRRLVAALGADATTRDPGSGVYLLLTDPAMRGDSSDVTVTVWYSTGADKRSRAFETIALMLVHDTRGWTIRRMAKIGTS